MLIAVWIGLGVVLLLAVFLVLAYVLGSRLPEEHVATMSLRLNQRPDAVWGLIADVEKHPSWSPGVNRVERKPDRNGHEAWQQTMGRNSFVLETTEKRAPEGGRGGVLLRTITDNNGPFMGSWRYEVAPDGGGTRLRLTEAGRVKSPIPRYIMHLMGETMYLKSHLKAVAKRFNEPSLPE